MYLLLSPPQELLFSGESNSDIICTLTLTNISKNTVAYKVRRVGEEVTQGICHSTDMVSSMGVWSYSYKAHICIRYMFQEGSKYASWKTK